MNYKIIRVEGEIAYVQLTRGQEAIIDKADVPLVIGASWNVIPHPSGGFYARSSPRSSSPAEYMHRLITNAPKGKEVDHINHNTLDNRRANLRVGSHAANLMNRRGPNKNSTTGIRGVYVHRVKIGDWHGTYYNARVQINGKHHTKNFPYTSEGLVAAQAWLEGQRREL